MWIQDFFFIKGIFLLQSIGIAELYFETMSAALVMVCGLQVHVVLKHCNNFGQLTFLRLSDTDIVLAEIQPTSSEYHC